MVLHGSGQRMWRGVSAGHVHLVGALGNEEGGAGDEGCDDDEDGEDGEEGGHEPLVERERGGQAWEG